MIDFFVILFGLIIGSFLSVCIYRIPLGRSTGLEELEEESSPLPSPEQESSLKNSPHFDRPVTICFPPRSFCPHCGKTLRWFHNIPLFGYLIQRGKCAECKTSISPRYPLVEVLTSLLAWCSWTTFEPVTALLVFVICAGLLVISFIDIDYYIIPNVITYPGFLLGLAFGGLQSYSPIADSPPFVAGIYDSFFGVLAGAGVLLAISLFYTYVRKKQGLGLGDVKLLAVTGAFLGVPGAFYTIFVGSLLGSVLGISLMIIGRGRWSSYLPFGPYLALATIIYIFLSQDINIALQQAAVSQRGY